MVRCRPQCLRAGPCLSQIPVIETKLDEGVSSFWVACAGILVSPGSFRSPMAEGRQLQQGRYPRESPPAFTLGQGPWALEEGPACPCQSPCHTVVAAGTICRFCGAFLQLYAVGLDSDSPGAQACGSPVAYRVLINMRRTQRVAHCLCKNCNSWFAAAPSAHVLALALAKFW